MGVRIGGSPAPLGEGQGPKHGPVITLSLSAAPQKRERTHAALCKGHTDPAVTRLPTRRSGSVARVSIPMLRRYRMGCVPPKSPGGSSPSRATTVSTTVWSFQKSRENCQGVTSAGAVCAANSDNHEALLFLYKRRQGAVGDPLAALAAVVS